MGSFTGPVDIKMYSLMCFINAFPRSAKQLGYAELAIPTLLIKVTNL
jgi:hypothetical protein